MCSGDEDDDEEDDLDGPTGKRAAEDDDDDEVRRSCYTCFNITVSQQYDGINLRLSRQPVAKTCLR